MKRDYRRKYNKKPSASERLARELQAEEELQAKLAVDLTNEDEQLARLLQEGIEGGDGEEVLTPEQEEELIQLKIMQLLQSQSDESLAMEIQTGHDDLRFAQTLQRELGGHTYSARCAQSLPPPPAQFRVGGEDEEEDGGKYSVHDLIQACTHRPALPLANSTSTRARLRELQAKDVRYNLAYLPEIQKTKQKLQKELRGEADLAFLERNPQVLDVVSGQYTNASIEVDLHFITVLQAQQRVAALFEFLVQNRRSTARVVLITGKGSAGPSKLGPAMFALCERRRDLVRQVVRGEGKLDVSLVRLL
ncbi:hypothetical protein BASA81_006739 [Batrachochytrium salamandrivorans]|nr:hypothetical protein BASA81_006739 [Batrachochytrium salamandrivorans]